MVKIAMFSQGGLEKVNESRFSCAFNLRRRGFVDLPSWATSPSPEYGEVRLLYVEGCAAFGRPFCSYSEPRGKNNRDLIKSGQNWTTFS